MEERDQDLLMNHEGLSRYEIVAAFHQRGYSKEEIYEKVKKSRLPGDDWKGSITGVFLIVIALALLVMAGDASAFEYELRSSKHIQSFGETILGVFLSVNFLVLGIMLLGNKERFPFRLKAVYIVGILIYGFIGLVGNSVAGALLALATIVTLVYVKQHSGKILNDLKLDGKILGKNRYDNVYQLVTLNVPAAHIPDVLHFNAWKGSHYFILFLLAGSFCLSETMNVAGEQTSLAPFVLLLNTLTILSSFAVGIVLAIDKHIIHKFVYLVLFSLYAVAVVMIGVIYGFQVIEVILIVLMLATILAYRESQFLNQG